MYQKSHFKYLYDVFLHVIIAVQWLSLLQFSRSVMSNQLWLHGLHHAKLPCPSPSPRVCSNSCSWSQWCHPTISSSVIPFCPCLHSFPASESFLMSWLFASGGQNIGASASASVPVVNIQDWFPLGLIGCISLAVQGTLRSLFQHHTSKASILRHSAFFIVQLSQSIHDYWKNHSFD